MELDANGTAVSTDRRFKCGYSELNLQIIRSDLSLLSLERTMKKKMVPTEMKIVPTKTLTKRKNRPRRSQKKKILLQREGLNSLKLR